MFDAFRKMFQTLYKERAELFVDAFDKMDPSESRLFFAKNGNMKRFGNEFLLSLEAISTTNTLV